MDLTVFYIIYNHISILNILRISLGLGPWPNLVSIRVLLSGPQGLLASAGTTCKWWDVVCVCCNASFYSLRTSLLSLPHRCCCLCLHLPPSPPVLPSLCVSQLESSIPQHPSLSLLFFLPLFIALSWMIMFLGSTLARKFYHTSHYLFCPCGCRKSRGRHGMRPVDI